MTPEHIKLAFALTLAQSIVDADQHVAWSEFSLWGQLFPRPLLRQMGFIDEDDCYTPHFTEACARVSSLESTLPEEEKLDLLLLLYGTAASDGDIDPREMAVVRTAAGQLGVTHAALDEAIRAFEESRE